VTRGWRYIAPVRGRNQNLRRIGQMLRDYDLVALQETDAGSLRSGNINQVEFLAHHAKFAHWHSQVNRDFGRFAQHSLGLLSRQQPLRIEEHNLPGRFKGRGALLAQFGSADNPLTLVITHLALGRQSQNSQLAYLRDLISEHRHVIMMGDTNCGPIRLLSQSPLASSQLRLPEVSPATYPSWQPRFHLDHILVSPDIKIHQVSTLQRPYSDHLPITMEIELPPKMGLERAA